MKEQNIREMRANTGRLDEMGSEEGDLVISRRGQPIARILPMAAHRQFLEHADPRQQVKTTK